MIKIYQIKDNGFLGETREIDPSQGVTRSWTYTPPPGDGSYKWTDGEWIAAEEPAKQVMVPLPPAPMPDLSRPILAPLITEDDPVVQQEEQPIQPE